ncbi:hypothetical protein [Fibrisoma limi]|nr:hypothetical protein [Fibrisoma limi]
MNTENDKDTYLRLYNRLRQLRDALVEFYGLNGDLKQLDPDKYQQCQKQINELNRQLRSLRLQLLMMKVELPSG